MSDVPTQVRFAPPRGRRVDVLVVAGEHSGDEQAARMVSTLLSRHPQMEVAAIGGPKLAAIGAQLLLDLTSTSVVGFVEVLRHYGFFRRVFREALRWIGEYRPRVVCFVDYPGFNLRLAQALAAEGLTRPGGGEIRAVYYIGPQIWAWKARRRFTMARTLDALAVIFPFEEACYADTSLAVHFVGHPFVSLDYLLPVVHVPTAPVLLLAGSRVAAVGRIAPALLDGFAAYRRTQPDTKATMLFPSDTVRAVLQRELDKRPDIGSLIFLQRNDMPVAASAVLTSSGTMSLVCALAGIPGAIAYRTNPLTFWLGRRLVKVPYIGIANLLLNEPMYPEFIQEAATPQALAAELIDATGNPVRIDYTRNLSEKLRHVLAQPPKGDAAAWLAEQVPETD